jgi:hypothetical protein
LCCGLSKQQARRSKNSVQKCHPLLPRAGDGCFIIKDFLLFPSELVRKLQQKPTAHESVLNQISTLLRGLRKLCNEITTLCIYWFFSCNWPFSSLL